MSNEEENIVKTQTSHQRTPPTPPPKIALGLVDGSNEPMNILLVEDDMAASTLLKLMLMRKGHSVFQVSDAQQALKYLQIKISFGLIVINNSLPDMSGIDLTRIIRQNPNWGDLRILLIGINNDPDSIQASLNAGADDYRTKPINRRFSG